MSTWEAIYLLIIFSGMGVMILTGIYMIREYFEWFKR